MAILAADGSAVESASLFDKVLRAGGVVGLLAFVLVLWLIASVSGDQKALADKQDTAKAAVDAHAAASTQDGKVQRQLLKAICLNVSKTDDARRLCEVGQ